MRKSTLLLVAAIAAVCPLRIAAQIDEVRRIGAEAAKLAESGRYAEGEAVLRGVIARLPSNARRERSVALFNLGWLKMHEASSAGDHGGAAAAAAIAAYEGVLVETPGNAQATQNLVLALESTGQRDRATALLEGVVTGPAADPTLGIMLMDRHIAAGSARKAWDVGIQLAGTNWDDLRIHDRLLLCRSGAPEWTVGFLAHLRRLQTRGPVALAQKGAWLLFMDALQSQPKVATQALVMWVDAAVEQGGLGTPDFDLIRSASTSDPEVSTALAELRYLVMAPAPEAMSVVGRLEWWRGNFDRRHAASGLIRARGDDGARRRAVKDAEAFYSAARALAPDPGEHASDGNPRRDERMAGLQAGAALARLYHRYRNEIDEDGRKLERLIRDIFDDKVSMYAKQNVAGMRQFHETLSVIYYDEERWSEAEFQLKRTVETEKKLAFANKKEPALLPHIERMRAESLVHLSRYEEAAEAVTSAAKGFIQLEQTEQIAPTLKVVERDLDKVSEPRRQEYLLLQTFSKETDKFDEQREDDQRRKIRDLEKLIPNEAESRGGLDRNWLGKALLSLAERADERAGPATRPDDRAKWSDEKTRLRREFPDLQKEPPAPKRRRAEIERPPK